MTDSAPPVPPIPKLAAPAGLLDSVSHRGSLLLRERRPAPSHRRARKLIADVSLATFCLLQLLWCAHIVGLIP